MTPKLYKAAEVCELTGLQPYVLRSWEKEFPGIGVQKSPDSVRLYRQSDVDQVRRIKQLVLGEGLTLAGARRRLEQTSPATGSSSSTIADTEALDVIGADARTRIATVRSGLRALLDTLSKAPGASSTAAAPERANGGRTGRSDREGAPSPDRRGAPASPPKRKVAVAAKRSVPTKRAATRKPTHAVRRKRSSA